MAYLENAWYAAAAATEVTEQPLARRLFDHPVVLYRAGDGAPIALRDECPHRFAPLSRGKVVGDALECGYHGLRFDRRGACVFNPHGDGVPPERARVRHFPTLERYGYVWFWPGDLDRADPALIRSEFAFLDDPDRFAVVKGYLHVKANYQLIVDNLLDLTHAPYLHPQFGIAGVSAGERLKNTHSELVRSGDSVLAKRTRFNSPPNDLSRKMFGVTAERMDSRSHMQWFPPSNLVFDLGMTEIGQAETDGICLPAAHLITPETELTSHYFFAQARNVCLDDDAVGQMQLQETEFAFRTQDGPMLEAQQARVGSTADLMSLGPILLQTDAPPLAARRLLARLIEAERGSAREPRDVTTRDAESPRTPEPVGR